MKTHPHLIIVAGTHRNVGKTEFITRLIGKFRPVVDLFGLKVSAVAPEISSAHKDHFESWADNVYEETRKDSTKDTSRMLQAGARRVFYLSGSNAADLLAGFDYFLRQIPAAGAIVCESNSLWHYIQPALLIVIRSPNSSSEDTLRKMLDRADLIISSDGISGFSLLNRITLDPPNSWRLDQNGVAGKPHIQE